MHTLIWAPGRYRTQKCDSKVIHTDLACTGGLIWIFLISLFRNLISKKKKNMHFKWYYIHVVRGGQYKKKRMHTLIWAPARYRTQKCASKVIHTALPCTGGLILIFLISLFINLISKIKKNKYFNVIIYMGCGLANIKKKCAHFNLSTRELSDPKM